MPEPPDGNTWKNHMTINIYNTMTGRKAPLSLLEEGHVKMYVCGITAYDYCHIGHARSALVFDMMVRYLRHQDYKVTYVRNFTDIDDKIIKRSQEQNTSCQELSERFIQKFHEDMEQLDVQMPTLEPKATEHIPHIIALIEQLIVKEYAYQVEGDVFFRVTKFKDYGKLSGRNLDEMQAGARISINEAKENPMDFALWKSSKPDEPTWESPWGPGRPGWHIECSAMSKEYLGGDFDIHGGGKDLIFPHHENEIAQSVCATGQSFAKTWIHHGFVTIKDEKMSKSLGNFLTIREVLQETDPEALRLLIFSTQYRNPLDFSTTTMEDAEAGLQRLYSCIFEITQLPENGRPGKPGLAQAEEQEIIATLSNRFHEAMDNDFNTAQALGHLFEAVKVLNRIRQTLPGKPATSDLTLLRQGADDIKRLANIIGLLMEDPHGFEKRKQEKFLQKNQLNPADINDLINQRNEARNAKDWQKADELREQLHNMGIELLDGPEGTSWKVKF